jgi:hypothetical protein
MKTKLAKLARALVLVALTAPMLSAQSGPAQNPGAAVATTVPPPVATTGNQT